MRSILRLALIVMPLVALLIVPAFICGTQPRFFGMPPIMWWILLWVALTPICLFAVEHRREE
ncbi:MAG TPA: DUF3311 domain-containing protein [Candidatus Cybelea sp.]|jgi:hypothetical protein